VGLKQLQQAIPVKLRTAGVKKLHDVGAVESFASGDEDLGCDELFRSEDAAGNLKDLSGNGPPDPAFVDDKARVADAGDEVDEILVSPNLGEPYGIFDGGVKALGTEASESVRDCLRRQEEIKILGGSPYAAVKLQCECTAYCTRQFAEVHQNVTVEVASVACPLRFRGRGDWKLCVRGHERFDARDGSAVACDRLQNGKSLGMGGDRIGLPMDSRKLLE
jgi:hypothetical protein